MQLAIFVTIAIVCLVLLIIGLVLGEIAEHGVELAHDVVDLATHDADAMGNGHGGPSPLGFRVVSAFGCGFGGAGAIATAYKLNSVASSAIGAGFGLLTGFAVYQFARFLYAQEAGEVFELQSAVGQPAEVSVAIPAGAAGQISFVLAGERRTLVARSADGNEIPQGSDVTIERIVGNRAVVRAGTPPEQPSSSQQGPNAEEAQS